MKAAMGWLKRIDDLLEHVLFDRILAPGRRAAVAMLAGTALLAAGLSGSGRPGTSDLKYLQERPWFDGYPVNPTPQKPYHAYLFTSDGMGIYVTLKSRYTQELELFYYKVKGDKIEIFLPETKTKATGPVSIGPASGPGDFDIQLDLGADPKNGGKAAKYYSWKHWGQGLRVDLAVREE